MKYIIKEQECGYLLKNGRFQSFLAAGSCHYIKAMGYELKIVPMTGAVNTCGIPVEVLMKNKEFSERVIRVNIPDECLAIRFVNKAFKEVLTGPEALYWNVFEDVEIRLVDITNPYMDQTLPRYYIDLIPVKFYKKITIKDGEIGLLYFDGKFEKGWSRATGISGTTAKRLPAKFSI